MAEKFIDVSAYNGVVDWRKVKQSGINFVIHRSTTRNGALDTKLRFNHMAAHDNGISMDYYKFMYSTDANKAFTEMDSTLDKLNDAKLFDQGATMWIDIESIKGVYHTRSMISDILDGAVQACENYGVDYGLYCNYYYLTKLMPAWYTGKIWIARYNSKIGNVGSFKDQLVFWQYTSAGEVPGISGKVDMNVFL